MDLASYLGISLQPLLEEKNNEFSKDNDGKQPVSISQLERHQPSVIKEEIEPENDGEDSVSNERIVRPVKEQLGMKR